MGKEGSSQVTVIVFHLEQENRAIKSVYNQEGRKIVEEELDGVKNLSIKGRYSVHRGLENITVYVVSGRSIEQEPQGDTLKILTDGDERG